MAVPALLTLLINLHTNRMSYFTKSCLLLVALFAAFTAQAQVGNDFAQYDLGIGGSINRVYGDAQTATYTKAAHASFNYNVTPFTNYVIELQYGELKGGDSLTTTSGRQFTNNFTAVMFRVQMQAGEVIDYSESKMGNALKNLYLSTGIGYVVNNMKDINRSSSLLPGFYTGGDSNASQLVIPARIGYEFKVFNDFNQPSFKVDIGYQYNFVMGDNLDGFTAGNKKDSYAQYCIGIKFAIGGITSYRKKISF